MMSACEKGAEPMLKDISRIRISGGCEVYAECSITFTPSGRGKARVRMDNSRHYFYDHDSNPIPSFEIEMPLGQLPPFFKKWMALADAIQKKPDYFSTRNAVVSFDLIFQDRKIQVFWAENDGGYHLDPIIDSIEAFVATCRKIKEQDRGSSKPSFRPENKTD